jgi:hypothetical protein
MLSSNSIVSRSWFMLLSLFALAMAASQAIAQSTIIVNGETLAGETVSILEQAYQTPLKPGRYWYDPVSGLWGTEKGPATGQIHPGMKLGGPLKADASGGGTGVFFNGRELHPQDVAALYQFTGVVIPGRYWINAMGVGGVEGGPEAFDLRALAAPRGGKSWSHSGPGGHTGSDGKCSYYFDPKSGSSVMTGDCD